MKIISRRILTTICVLAALISSPSQARDVSIVTVDWQPYYGSDLPDGGVIADITRQSFARAGHNASIEYIPWTRALKLVTEGEKDIVMGAYYNDERAKTYIMSDPMYALVLGLISLRDSGITQYDALEDLKPYRIGTSRGYANSKEFDAADFLNKDIARNSTINLRKLQRKRIDLMVAAFGIFRYELSQVGGDTRDYNFVRPPLSEERLYIMGSRAIPDGQKLINDFNRGLKLIRQDGTYEQILKKHGF